MGEQKGTKSKGGTQRLRFGLSLKRGLELGAQTKGTAFLNMQTTFKPASLQTWVFHHVGVCLDGANMVYRG